MFDFLNKENIKNQMTLKELVEEVPSLLSLAEVEIDRYFQVDGGYSPYLKVREKDGKLQIISLAPKSLVLSNYDKIIPDNKFSYAGDFTLKKVEKEKHCVKVKISYNTTIDLFLDVFVFEFDIKNKVPVDYPTDYMIGNYGLLAETIQNSNPSLIDIETKKGWNKEYSVHKSWWINEIKKSA